MKRVLDREVRKWIYAVAIAAFPILVYYGLIDVKVVPLWLALILALLNLEPKPPEAIPDGTGRYRADD